MATIHISLSCPFSLSMKKKLWKTNFNIKMAWWARRTILGSHIFLDIFYPTLRHPLYCQIFMWLVLEGCWQLSSSNSYVSIFPHLPTDPFLRYLDIIYPATRCFPGSSDGKESAYNAGDPGSIPGSEITPGEGNGNPLQYSCLENSMDRGAWRVTVYGGHKESDTTEWLTHTHTHTHTHTTTAWVLLIQTGKSWKNCFSHSVPCQFPRMNFL